MSIELITPETVAAKIDAAANYVAQIRIAVMLGDASRVLLAVSEVERLLYNATCQIEKEGQSK
jgi:hypothetical protein